MSKNVNKGINIIVAIILVLGVFALLWYFFGKEEEVVIPIDLNIPKTITTEDGSEIAFEWTDDNTGEDLIIQSDKKSYFGINKSEIYFSVTNANKNDQEMNIRLLFADDLASLEKIEKIFVSASDSEAVQNDVDRFANAREDEVSQSETSSDVFANGVKQSRELSLTDDPVVKFKNIKDFNPSLYTQDFIKSGETNYYKATINYKPNTQGEFYIEAKGDNGAYGILDPWYNSSGLIGYWSFDGEDMDWSTTTAEVIDGSGFGNDGNALDGVSAGIGKSGQAIRLDGDADYVAVGDHINWDLGAGDFTTSYWINLNTNTQGTLFSLDQYNVGIMTYLWGGSIYTYVANQWTNASWVPDANSWYHVVVTRDSGFVQMYVDGSSVGTGETLSNSVTVSNGLRIGFGFAGSANRYVDGLIDEVAIYNRALSVDEITDLYNLGNRRSNLGAGSGTMQINTSNVNRLTSGLVGHWTFDGPDMDWSSTTAEALDRSGQGNNGDAVNMTSVNAVIGKVGQALSFERGNTEYINIMDDNSLDPGSSAWSWGAWAKINNVSDVQALIFKKFDSNANYAQYAMNINLSKIYCLQSNSGGSWTTNASSALPTDGGWHHYLCVNNGSTATLYIDGQSAAVDSSVASSINDTTSDLRIGWGRISYADRYFDGLIDEVRVYNRDLSTDEISELYNMGAKKFQIR